MYRLSHYNPQPIGDDTWCITGGSIQDASGRWIVCPSDGSDCEICDYCVPYQPQGPIILGGSDDFQVP